LKPNDQTPYEINLHQNTSSDAKTVSIRAKAWFQEAGRKCYKNKKNK